MIQFLSVEYFLPENERCPALSNLLDFFALSKRYFSLARLFFSDSPLGVTIYVFTIFLSFKYHDVSGEKVSCHYLINS